MSEREPEYALVVPIEEGKPRRPWWILALLSFLLLPVALYGISKIPSVEQYRLSDTRGAIAIYSDCALEGNPSFETLYMTASRGGPAKLYVQINDGRQFFLPEFPEQIAAELLKRTELPGRTMYRDGYSMLEYRDGTLIYAALSGISKDWKISRRSDGPFVALPLGRETLLREFGPPMKWDPPHQFRQGSP